jgi:SAM-dependent methyltransferase
MHWDMVSEIDVTSVVMGKIREGNIVLNLGLRQKVLTSYVIRVWNGFAISVNASRRILESVRKKIDETGSQRRAFLLQASVDHLPLRGECIDAVISIFTTQSLLREEALQLLQEFKRVLIKTGRFVLVEWVFEPKSNDNHANLELREILTEKKGLREHSLDYKEYCQILNMTGFEIEEIRFLPRRIYLKGSDAVGEEETIELLQKLDKMDSGQLQINLVLISSRVKR